MIKREIVIDAPIENARLEFENARPERITFAKNEVNI